MSSTRILDCWILAIVRVPGIFLGVLRLSQFAAVGIGLVPAMLLACPLIDQLVRWASQLQTVLLIIAGILIVGTLVHLVIG